VKYILFTRSTYRKRTVGFIPQYLFYFFSVLSFT
jgi:hypothetical protein